MARFNQKTKASLPDTVNLAGGEAFSQTAENELALLAITSRVSNQYYRTADQQIVRMRELIAKVDPLFAAKAALYARHEFGQRSISHVMAGEIADYASGTPWGRDFYDRVVRRTDDIMEVLAYFQHKKGRSNLKNMPKAMQYGLARAFAKFDGYQLAKYRREGNDISLIDAVCLLHPKPTAKNRAALEKLVKGELVSDKTWEAKQTQAGQKAETVEQKQEMKSAAWAEQVNNKELGYMALVRNIGNIAQNAPEVLEEVCEQLRNEVACRRSKIEPYRFILAVEEFSRRARQAGVRSPLINKVIDALDDAAESALNNIELLEGDTLVALDDSGSMFRGSNATFRKGAILAAAFVKIHGADFVMFSNILKEVSEIRRMKPLAAAQMLSECADGGFTNMALPFQHATRRYDNVVILSDMQSWDHAYTGNPSQALKRYEQRFNHRPAVYLIDLQGAGTAQFPEYRVATTGGYMPETFKILSKMTVDANALVNEIEKIELG